MKGTADKAEGAIKDTAGKFTGDKELQLYKEALTTAGSKSYIPPSDGTATLSAGLCKGRTRALTLGADDIIF